MSRSKTARKVSEATGALSHTRIRLSRQSLKSFPSIDIKAATSVSALQDSGKSPGGKWLDQERDHVQAYEYLCHCSEAQQWMERCIGEPLGGDIANMAEEMRNGIALAKVAKSFEPSCVPRIFVHPKLQFRHTDNINYYFQFVDKIRLPSCFRFELTDLYEKKNFPKVVYCLHALSHFMAHHGRSDKVDDLVGKLEFDEEQLFKTQKTIERLLMENPDDTKRAMNVAEKEFVELLQADEKEIQDQLQAGADADGYPLQKDAIEVMHEHLGTITGLISTIEFRISAREAGLDEKKVAQEMLKRFHDEL